MRLVLQGLKDKRKDKGKFRKTGRNRLKGIKSYKQRQRPRQRSRRTRAKTETKSGKDRETEQRQRQR